MLQLERQRAIVGYLTRKGFASVTELCEKFSVSEMTIRRDLAELDNQGLLQRIYGGAVANEAAFFEFSLKAKVPQFAEEKERIGKVAAEMVEDGDTVLLDAGSTTTQVARHLKDKRITVVTNALNIAAELSDCQHIRLLVAGGILRRGVLAIVGPQTETFLQDVRADKLFLGVEGVDVKGGLTVPDVIEAHTKRAMVRSARQTIVVADRSKLGRDTLSTIVPLSEADLLITGKEIAEEIIEQLKGHIEVVTV